LLPRQEKKGTPEEKRRDPTDHCYSVTDPSGGLDLSSFQLGKDNKMSSELYALLKRRGFFWPSYEIYGSVAGFYDLGPLGSQLLQNIEKKWKDRFVIQEDFLLVDCPTITPEIAFKYSGHLDKFTDYLTKCKQCSAPFRADHLLEGITENADSLEPEELQNTLDQNNVKCPTCGGDLGPLEDFNLMFKTFIGPGGEKVAYLRPETAQSIFMDFSLLYRVNRERIPFGVAQLGKGFRNEISPRQGMLRLREFHMAEGEFFFDPQENRFSRFEEYRYEKVTLVPNTDPDKSIETTLGEAVANGMICSEVLGHYMGVTKAFAKDIGIPEKHMRFREHLRSEMAHYARDCWDLEVELSSGWIEMVGIADRSAYDLNQHTKGSGQDLVAKRMYPKPIIKDITKVEVSLKVLGPVFRGEANIVADALMSMDPSEVKIMVSSGGPIIVDMGDGNSKEIPLEAVTVTDVQQKVSHENFTPHVVEPSFGLDRLMIAVIEHSYKEMKCSPMKDDADEDEGPYRVLSLDPGISPIKCGVFPLMNKDGLPELAKVVEKDLKKIGLTTYFDHSGSIGRRYARMDEIGTPFSITIDYESRDDNSATIRMRDSGEQIRVPFKEIPKKIRGMISNF
jgi:glycyl-tRNA synthetase